MSSGAYWCAAPRSLALPDVLEQAGAALGEGAIGFVSSAVEHAVVLCSDGELRTAGGAARLDGTFSVRLADPRAELRWLHTGGGLGDAVLVTEDPDLLPGWEPAPIPVAGTRDGAYALWGRRLEPHPRGVAGWCRAPEGRLGWVDLPLDAPSELIPADQTWPERYAELIYREYFALDGYGNASVIEERLLGLQVGRATGRSS